MSESNITLKDSVNEIFQKVIDTFSLSSVETNTTRKYMLPNINDKESPPKLSSLTKKATSFNSKTIEKLIQPLILSKSVKDQHLVSKGGKSLLRKMTDTSSRSINNSRIASVEFEDTHLPSIDLPYQSSFRLSTKCSDEEKVPRNNGKKANHRNSR